MSDEEERQGRATVPPPDGAEDVYSASTTVGVLSADLLALARSGGEGAAPARLAPPRPTPAPATPALATPAPASPMVASDVPAPMQIVADDVEAPAQMVASDFPPPLAEAPDAAVGAARPERPASGLPPAAAILLVFAIAAGVLALVAR